MHHSVTFVGFNSRWVVVVYSHVVYIVLITDYIFNTIFISSFEGLPTGIRAEYGTWQIFGIITFRRQWPCNNGLIIPLMNTTILLFATQSQSYVINPTPCFSIPLFVGPIYYLQSHYYYFCYHPKLVLRARLQERFPKGESRNKLC